MPRHRRRPAGICLALLALAGCSLDATGPAAPSAPAASESAQPAASSGRSQAGSWNQELSFSGDVTGVLSQAAAVDPALRSGCTGRNSRSAGSWASTLFGYVGKEVYGLVVTVPVYRGPATYRGAGLSVQLHRADNSAVWQTGPSDSAAFTVAEDEESGTIDATLTNLATTRTRVRVSGRWSCRT